MGFIALIIFGLLAGLIARAILPGRQPGGWLTSLICGVIGALLAGWVTSAILKVDIMGGFFNLGTWVAGIIGALVVTFVWQAIVRRRG